MANQITKTDFLNLVVKVLNPTIEWAQGIHTKVPQKTALGYIKIYERISGYSFQNLMENSTFEIGYDYSSICEKIIHISGAESTLRMYARAVRYVHYEALKNLLFKHQNHDELDELIRLLNQNGGSKYFNTLTKLASEMPSEYKSKWNEFRVKSLVERYKHEENVEKSELELKEIAESKIAKQRKKPRSKKYSLGGLKPGWEIDLAKTLNFSNQFALPAIVCFVTGCRPSEVEKGVDIFMNQGKVNVKIIGSKLTAHAGQKERVYCLPDNELSKILKNALINSNSGILNLKVAHGNSITQFISRASKKLWPRKKVAVSCYSVRHSLIRLEKEATHRGLVEVDFPSKSAGHRVDKTITNYAKRRSGNSKSDLVQQLDNSQILTLIPASVKVTFEIKKKNKKFSYDRVISKKSIFKP